MKGAVSSLRQAVRIREVFDPIRPRLELVERRRRELIAERFSPAAIDTRISALVLDRTPDSPVTEGTTQ